MSDFSFDDICRLGTIVSAINDAGDAKETITYGDVIFCFRKSVGYREIQAGASSGFRPDALLVLPFDEYHEERYVEYGGERYKVARTYRDGWNVELTLERV